MHTTIACKTNNRYPCPQFLFRPQISSSVTSVCHIVHNQNDVIICGTDCGELMVWSLTTYRLQSIIDSNNNTRAIHLIPFNNRFLCQHKNGVINVFSDKFIIEKSYPCSDISFCNCFLFICPNSDTKLLSVVSQTNNRFIDIIEFNSDNIVCTVGINDNKYGMSMTVHMTDKCSENDGQKQVLLFIGYENGFLTLFKVNADNNSSQLMSQLKCFDSEIITCMDFNDKTDCGVCGSIGEMISVWQIITCVEDSSIILTLKRNIKLTNAGLLSCAIRIDGRILATAGSDYRIRIFAFKTLKALAVLDNHKQPIDCILFTDKLNKELGYLLIASSRDKTISVWSLYNN